MHLNSFLELFIPSVFTDDGNDLSSLKGGSLEHLNGIKCFKSDGSFEPFNSETRFLSYCFILIVAISISVTLLGPTVYRIFDLSHHERLNSTSVGQLAFVSSCLAHLSFLSYFFAYDLEPSLAEGFIVTVGYITCILQYVQDGRVEVSSGEVLLYWSGMDFCYLSFALDSYLRKGITHSILLVSAGIFATLSLLLELNHSQPRDGEAGASFDTANIFSKLSMSYANEMLIKGARGPLKHNDLPNPPKMLNARNYGKQFELKLAKRSEVSKSRIIASLVEIMGLRLGVVIFLDVLNQSTNYLSPLVLKFFLSSLENFRNSQGPLFVTFYYGVLLSLMPLLQCSLGSLSSLNSSYIYDASRTSLLSAIYQKSFRLSPGEREKYTSSKIMNLITVDIPNVYGFFSYLPLLISLPVGMIIATYQLWVLLGVSMLVSLIHYGILVPLSGHTMAKYRLYFPQQMKIKDKRNKLTSNLFRSIKSLKLYAWELPFFRRVVNVREREELALVRKIIVIMATYTTQLETTKSLVAVGVFTVYLWLQEGSLVPSVVFPSILLFDLVTNPFRIFSTAMASLAQALTSQRRINDFLVAKEQDHANITMTKEPNLGYEQNTVDVENATVSWNGEDIEQKLALKCVSFACTRGDLVCITGRVGAGKTALLRALSGDLSILNGHITIKGSIAFCSQDAWLQNLTLKENVLFGQAYDKEWYNRVLCSCQLWEDIEQMPDGDNTGVGERGIILSGGQKARVSLARALYSRADIYLLDDILSAVDEHVSTHLIKHVLGKDGILGNRTIILATNNVKVLSHASRIIELDTKRVSEKASFEEVIARGKNSKIYRLIEEFGHAQDVHKSVTDIEPRKPHIIHKEKVSPNFYLPSHYEAPLLFEMVSTRRSSDDDEEQEKCLVMLNIFKSYFKILPYWMYVVLLSLIVLAALILCSRDVLLGLMSKKGFSNIIDARYYLLGYFAIVVLSIVSFICAYVWNSIYMGLRASNILHNRMLWNLMHAPMSFFDTTPLGRLINLFTRDIATLDMDIPKVFFFLIQTIIEVLVMTMFIISSSPITTLVIIPLGFFGNNIRLLYVPTQKKIFRMNAAANSPILSHVEDSLKGQLIIRSFDRVSQFNNVFETQIDYWIKVLFTWRNISIWLNYRLQLMTAALMLATTISLSWLVSQNAISVGYSGIILKFASSICGMLHQTLANFALIETSSVSLDRVLSYVNIEQEAPPHIESTKPDEGWPSSGIVKFDNFSARYKVEGPDILRNITFSTNGSEKIGIVGRTGSGKSTLALALFRLLEARGGHIDIDDINTSVLGLSDLRSKLSIIPQDAQIFDGTLRENLDPLYTADDAKLWEILELCHLKRHFQSVEGGLDARLADGGDNISRGQAQLVCLGRALLHETKVLVLDEATASVDVETDRVVQETIRRNFRGRTIITIAHRINTIMDSDRILVLDYGEVKEFGKPQELLDSRGVYFELYVASNNAEDKPKSSP